GLGSHSAVGTGAHVAQAAKQVKIRARSVRSHARPNPSVEGDVLQRASPASGRPSRQTLGIESSAHAMNSRNRFAAPTAPLRVQGERSPLSLASKAALVLVALQVAISFVHLPFVVFLAQAGAMSVVHMLKLLASSVFLFVGTALFVARVRAASYFLAAS